MNCPTCHPNTAGEHEADCPNNPNNCGEWLAEDDMSSANFRV